MVAPRRVATVVVLASVLLITGLGIESANRHAGDASFEQTLRKTIQTGRAHAQSSSIAPGSSGRGPVFGGPIFGGEAPVAVDLERDLPQLPEPPRPKATPQRQATVVFSGDMIPHGPVTRQAQSNGRAAGAEFDFVPMFAEVADIIRAADLALCHMETPLSSTNTRLGGYPVFNAPHELAEAVADAGYDGCSLASNHSYDRSESGVIDTASVLDDAGLGFAGIARSEEEALAVTTYEVKGISVAHLSFTYGLNGFRLPLGKGYLVDLIDPDLIEQRAEAARSGGADVVIVSLHWGSEYVATPNTQQTSLAARLRGNPNIDLIVGHHSHVVQPIDATSPDDVVVFGLGNFLSNQSADCCLRSTQDGVIVKVTFEEKRSGGFKVVAGCIVPTWVDRSDYVILPAVGSGRLAPEASVERTNEVAGRMGAFDSVFDPTCPVAL